jgi:uncharacterized protein (TIGR00297 family)
VSLAAWDRHLIRCAARIAVSPNTLADIFGGLAFDHSLFEARLIPALVVTSLFGWLGYLAKGVTRSGAIAGTSAALLIYLGLGLGGFVTLFAVFAITWLTTRVGYSRKRSLGLAEDRRGRSAGQVLANLAVAAGFAVLAIPYPIFGAAAVAALAEAAADTAASEIGEVLSGHAWLITSLRVVEPGTNGAVSLPGTLAGMSAAIIIAYCAVLMQVLPASGFWWIAVAGYLGTVVDSLLGATLERSHRFSNNQVNLLSTLSGGLIALALFR